MRTGLCERLSHCCSAGIESAGVVNVSVSLRIACCAWIHLCTGRYQRYPLCTGDKSDRLQLYGGHCNLVAMASSIFNAKE